MQTRSQVLYPIESQFPLCTMHIIVFTESICVYCSCTVARPFPVNVVCYPMGRFAPCTAIINKQGRPVLHVILVNV